jgi:hypothetical protein
MVTYVTDTKNEGEQDKGKVVEYSNKHWRERKMDRMSPYITEKAGGFLVEHKNEKEINITVQTEGLKNKCKKIKTKI